MTDKPAHSTGARRLVEAARRNVRPSPARAAAVDQSSRPTNIGVMIELLIRDLRHGKRKLAMVGASHVVMQETGLRERLRLVIRRGD